MSEGATAASFVAKWRARWPEWNVAEAFVDPGQRPVAEAWFALLQEIREAAWSGEDPTPGLAKLAWWHEELEGWAKGVRRHPLGQILQRQPAPWSVLARALNSLPATRPEPAQQAARGVHGFAGAVAQCEVALFGRGRDGDAAAGDAHGVLELAERVLLTGERSDIAWLLERWPGLGGAVRARRVHSALLRRRLQTLPDGGQPVPLPGWRVLLAAWRAARGR